MNHLRMITLASVIFGTSCSESTGGADIDSDGYISSIEATAELSKLDAINVASGRWEIESNAPALRGVKKVKSCLSPERMDRIKDEILVFDNWQDNGRFPPQFCEFYRLEIEHDSIDIDMICGEQSEQYSGKFSQESFEITRRSDVLGIQVSSKGRRLGMCDESNDEL